MTVGISIAILIVTIVSSEKLKFGDANPGDPILWPDSQYNTDISRINDRFPGIDQMWIVIDATRSARHS